MAFTKTRIWRGGVAGSGSQEPDHDTVVPSEPAPQPRLTGDAAVHTELEAGWERAARARAAQAPGFDRDEHTPPFAITRLWPIEELFPDEHGAPSPPVAPIPKLPAPAWSTPSPLEGTLKLWWRGLRARTTTHEALPGAGARLRRVGVALLCLTCLVVATQLVPRARDRLRPAHAASPPALPDPPAALQGKAGQARPAAAAHTDGAPHIERSSLPPGLERSAIDALVAGDMARAKELYQRLAEAAPEQPAFSQALRVIAGQEQGRP